jgi:hypothetical protein
MSNCIECNNKKGIYRNKLEKVICKDCMSLDKYKLIVKTKAKQEYLLVEDDLEYLDEYYATTAFGNGEATYNTKRPISTKYHI